MSDDISFDFSRDIALGILDYLGGWTLENESNRDNNENDIIPNLLDASEYPMINNAKKITCSEVARFYQKAVNNAEAYLHYKLTDEELTDVRNIILEAVQMWAAGLLWRKYNIRVMDQVDETNTTGYGDELIIQSKVTLKRYAYVKVSTW